MPAAAPAHGSLSTRSSVDVRRLLLGLCQGSHIAATCHEGHWVEAASHTHQHPGLFKLRLLRHALALAKAQHLLVTILLFLHVDHALLVAAVHLVHEDLLPLAAT